MTSDGFQILGLDHVQLAMPIGGETRARRFYGESLGMTEIAKPPHLALRGGCWFECGALRLHLGAEEGFRPAHKAHPAILVLGLAALRLRLEGAGFETTEDEALENLHSVYVNDPFGNRIELLERGTSSPADLG